MDDMPGSYLPTGSAALAMKRTPELQTDCAQPVSALARVGHLGCSGLLERECSL